jgi:peroxin-6
LRQCCTLLTPFAEEDEVQSPKPPSNSYIAISPVSPLISALEEIPWTILAARRQFPKEAQADTASSIIIRIPPSAPGFQSFLKNFEALNPDKHVNILHKPIDVRALCIRPVRLSTIFVTVEKNILRDVDEVQNKFGGGFLSVPKGRSNNRNHFSSWKKEPLLESPETAEDRLTAITREGLSKLDIVHSGDIFALPLPSHPITHVSPSPAIVAACEPVSQGLLASSTKIVLIQAGSSQEKALKRLRPSRQIIEEVIEDDGEDTSNDQFYSAAEDRHNESVSEGDGNSNGDGSGTEDSSQSHSDDGSDDSLEDMISLSAPGLPPQSSGTLSALTAATPRPGGRRTGAHTPGSVYSSWTSATARASSRSAKLFSTEALLQKVPCEALHPRPSLEDDEDSFVFVDITALAKIGCFSGDWARLEAVRKPPAHGFTSLNLSEMNGLPEEVPIWRPVRIFGLAGLAARSPRYAVDKSGDRRSSFSRSLPSGVHPTALVPPFLLSGLGETPFVKLSPLLDNPNKGGLNPLQKQNARPSPPFAREVTLRRILTPLATTRDLDQAQYAGLQKHFEQKRRFMKTGDLIAIPVDEDAGRATFSPPNNTQNSGFEDELPNEISIASGRKPRKAGVVWFCIDNMSLEATEGSGEDSADTWSGVAVVDVSSITRMAQVGSSIQRIPILAQRTWQYWFGLKKGPRQSSPTSVASAPVQDIPTPLALPLVRRLGDLVSAATSPRAISLGLPPLVVLLYSTQRQVGKSYTAKAACSLVGVQTFSVSAHDVLAEGSSTTGGGDVKTESVLSSRAERAFSCGTRFTALLIQHVDVLTADRMVPALRDIVAEARVVIATTTEIDKVPDGVRSLFTHELEITAPNESEREIIIKNACLEQSLYLDPSVDLSSVALKTAALVAGDLVDVVNRALLARSKRLEKLAEDQNVSLPDIILSGGSAVKGLLDEDFTAAVSHARSTFSDSIGAPKIPTVTWDDVGGLADQKSSIMETISLPLTRPELFAKGMRKRSGILFYGPPGTGKTLLAKAIATEFSLNFFSVKGPELLNMYIGESEANVRRVFQRARDARPCVVFFDELDSVAPKRGNQGDSGGVMDRIVSQLLAELDGMSSSGGSSEDSEGPGSGGNGGGVFVIGATNRPDLLDPALLRPGRFDKMLYLGVSSTHDQQVTILEALTRKFNLAPDVDLKHVAEKLPFTYTGADLYALCSDAMLKAISRKTRLVDEKVKGTSRLKGEDISTPYFFDHLASPEDVEVTVREEDFVAAQKELVASVRFVDAKTEILLFPLLTSSSQCKGAGSFRTHTRPIRAARSFEAIHHDC